MLFFFYISCKYVYIYRSNDMFKIGYCIVKIVIGIGVVVFIV